MNTKPKTKHTMVMDDVRLSNDGFYFQDGDAALWHILNQGSVVILRRALAGFDLDGIVDSLQRFAREKPPSNPPVTVGVPSYHRFDVEPPRSNVKSICHLFSTFYWDPVEFGASNRVLRGMARTRNRLAGLPKDYAQEQIDDGHVSVPCFLHYPAGGGYLATHKDPPSIQKVVIIAILSKKGRDFRDGGLYVEGAPAHRVLVEDQLDQGDVYVFPPDVRHGVAPIDPMKTLDFAKRDGRWMMMSSLVTVASLHGEAGPNQSVAST